MTDFLLEGMLYEHTPLLFLSFLFFFKNLESLLCAKKTTNTKEHQSRLSVEFSVFCPGK